MLSSQSILQPSQRLSKLVMYPEVRPDCCSALLAGRAHQILYSPPNICCLASYSGVMRFVYDPNALDTARSSLSNFPDLHQCKIHPQL